MQFLLVTDDLEFRDAKRCSWNRSLEMVVNTDEQFNVQGRINEQVLLAVFVSLLLLDSYERPPIPAGKNCLSIATISGANQINAFAD